MVEFQVVSNNVSSVSDSEIVCNVAIIRRNEYLIFVDGSDFGTFAFVET